MKKIFILLFVSASFHAAQAQTVEQLAAQFPNDYAVILNHTEELSLFMKDGKPQGERRITVELLALDDKANELLSRYAVFHGSFDEVKDLEAYTKVPDGNSFKKIKVTEIKTEDATSQEVFYDDEKESWFYFPSFTKGTHAFVSYTQEETDAHLLSPYYASSYLPVVHSRFTLSFPSDMQVKYDVKNDSAHVIQVTEDNRGREHQYTFEASNIKRTESFAGAPSFRYYEPHAIFRIASYEDDGKQVKFLDDVNDLYKWYYSFVGNLDNTNDPQLKSLADSLTAGVTDPEEKARRIYSWVQHNIKYVAFENGLEGFIPRRAATVCTRRFGDCKDMASLLTALLQLSGVKAYFTWIGTRDIPYDYTDVPLPITDNHMIAAVNINDKWIFLDGTDPNCIFGYPSGFIQGKQALVGISENEYKLLRVPEVESEKNGIVDSTFISVTDKGISGNSSVYYNGYFGTDINDNLLYKDEKDKRDFVKSQMGKASNKFILGDYKVNTINQEKQLVNIQAKFDVPDYSKKIADELYINLNLQKLFTPGSIIDTAKRKVGLENEFRYDIKQYTILDVPGDYKVSYVPKDFSIDNDVFGFSIHYTQKDDKVIACQELRNKSLLMQPAQFNGWNNAIKQILTQYREQLVLQKK
ncbi:MAG TPA: DUF3857 domain-containing protein [Chitinophagaceae bacterium]|nr:DUF3857 domain-containing protein [Chitinophagaceae bacterium]